MPKDSRYDAHYPYQLAGRVMLALLRCPRCGTWMRFQRRTGISIRCPLRACQKTWVIGINLCDPAHVGTYSRPFDSIAAVGARDAAVPVVQGEEPRDTDVSPAVPHSLEPDVAPDAPHVLSSWKPGSEIHRVDGHVQQQFTPEDD